MSLTKLLVTTAYSTYTYKLGNIILYTISWFRWDVRTHIWKIYDVKVKTIPLIIQCSRIFPMFYSISRKV